MASLSDVGICSRAVTRLGGDAFSSFEEDDIGIVCAENYSERKKAVLGSYPWRITMKKKKLQRDATDPINEWTYSHQVPNDGLDGHGAIKAVWPNSGAGGRPLTDYEIFGKFICSHQLELWVDYQQDVGESELPPHLVEMLILDMMVVVAMPLTETQSNRDAAFLAAYGSPSEAGRGGYWRTATIIDQQQQPPQQVDANDFIDVRFS